MRAVSGQPSSARVRAQHPRAWMSEPWPPGGLQPLAASVQPSRGPISPTWFVVVPSNALPGRCPEGAALKPLLGVGNGIATSSPAMRVIPTLVVAEIEQGRGRGPRGHVGAAGARHRARVAHARGCAVACIRGAGAAALYNTPNSCPTPLQLTNCAYGASPALLGRSSPFDRRVECC